MLKKETVDAILAAPENMVCRCEEDCRFHGMCRECVALHRFNGRIPFCLQQISERRGEKPAPGER